MIEYCPDGADIIRYSETEERILKAFAAFVTIELGIAGGELCLVLRFNHPDFEECEEIPIMYNGEYTAVNRAIEHFAKLYLHPSKPFEIEEF